MPAKTDPREDRATEGYYYRRSLSVREVLPAVAVGVIAGTAVFYLARLMLERTPISIGGDEPRRRAPLARPRGA